MILTKKLLQEYLVSRRINIPEKLEKNLLKKYGKELTDNDGHIYEYSEQDIYEQMRKLIQNFQEGEELKTKF